MDNVRDIVRDVYLEDALATAAKLDLKPHTYFDQALVAGGGLPYWRVTQRKNRHFLQFPDIDWGGWKSNVLVSFPLRKREMQ